MPRPSPARRAVPRLAYSAPELAQRWQSQPEPYAAHPASIRLAAHEGRYPCVHLPGVSRLLFLAGDAIPIPRADLCSAETARAVLTEQLRQFPRIGPAAAAAMLGLGLRTWRTAHAEGFVPVLRDGRSHYMPRALLIEWLLEHRAATRWENATTGMEVHHAR